MAPILIEPNGRKKIFIGTKVCSGISFVLMVMLPKDESLALTWSENFLKLMIFWLGLNQLMAFISGYSWFTEFMPLKWQPYAITLWMV